MLHIETCCCGATLELRVGESRLYSTWREEREEAHKIRSEWRARHKDCKPRSGRPILNVPEDIPVPKLEKYGE